MTIILKSGRPYEEQFKIIHSHYTHWFDIGDGKALSFIKKNSNLFAARTTNREDGFATNLNTDAQFCYFFYMVKVDKTDTDTMTNYNGLCRIFSKTEIDLVWIKMML